MNKEINDSTIKNIEKVVLTDVEECLNSLRDVDDLAELVSSLKVLKDIFTEDKIGSLEKKAQRKVMGRLYNSGLRLVNEMGIYPVDLKGEIKYNFDTDNFDDLSWILDSYEFLARKYGVPKERVGRARTIVDSVLEKRMKFKEDYKYGSDEK